MRRTEKTFPQTRTFIQIENHFHVMCLTSSPYPAASAAHAAALVKKCMEQVIQPRSCPVTFITRCTMLTKLNIINLGLIAILFASLVVHTAGADTTIAPAKIVLPFSGSY